MVESSAPGNGESPPAVSTSDPSSDPASTPIESIEAAGLAPSWGATPDGPPTTLEPTSSESTNAASIEPAAPSPSLPVSPPAPEPEPAGEPTFTHSIEVPATPSAEAEAGGEWELLLSKINQWLESGELQSTLQRLRNPLLALGALLGLVLVLRVYGALLGAIDSLPLLPGLLELAGVIWLARFAINNLVRSSERQALISTLQRRWKAFLGSR